MKNSHLYVTSFLFELDVRNICQKLLYLFRRLIVIQFEEKRFDFLEVERCYLMCGFNKDA